MSKNVADVTDVIPAIALFDSTVRRRGTARCRAARWRVPHGVGVTTVVLCASLAGCSFHPNLTAVPPDPSASTRFLSADGALLATLDRGEHREPVALDAIAHSMQDAVVAIEDHRFFEHNGVDLQAIGRAIRADLRSGDLKEGGSTITQQYVRRVLLTNKKTLHRKIREAILAIELERKYTKAQILERYLNEVYFGDGAYGVQVAAQQYFGIDARALNVGQAATLAGLLQAPENYNPRHNPQAARQRRDEVLAAMHAYGYLDEPSRIRAEQSPIVVSPRRSRNGNADYFVEVVRRWFLSNAQFGATEAERAELLYRGGLTITTTLDPRNQAEAVASIREVLSDPNHDPSAALVSIRPSDGAVTAYVGGRGFDGPESYAQFDLAGSSRRPSGSTFKPFVLAAALERHIPISRQYAAPSTLTLHPNGTVAWPVHNFEGEAFAKLDLLDATVHSVNTVYAQLMLDVGPEYAVSVAQRLGVTTKLDGYACAVLGCNAISPVDVASAYATFAADGMHHDPQYVTKIVDRNQHLVYEAHTTAKRAIAASIARVVNHTLEQVVTRGTGVHARIGRPVAGKTGTTDDYRDAWFAGSTPELTSVVWVGSGATPTAMLPPRTRIKVTGGTWPTDIWARYTSSIMATVPIRDFPQPSTNDAAGVLAPTSLPSVLGMPRLDAVNVLSTAGYSVHEEPVIDTNYPPGTITGQSPDPRTAMRAGSLVTITVAHAEHDAVVVPMLLGLPLDELQLRADRAGITLLVTKEAEPAPGSANRSHRSWKQSIASGILVVRDSTIEVTINPG